MKILLTGSAGFIGYHLTKRLLENGHEVTGIDSINSYYDVNLKYDRLLDLGINKVSIRENISVESSRYLSFNFLQLNIAFSDVFTSTLEGEKFDVIIHLAAQAGVRYSITNPQAYVEINLIGFSNILEFSRQIKVKHLIYASSSSVYGNYTELPFKETANTDQPVSLYAATKKSNELLAFSYSHLYDLPVTGLRFFTVYGPWGRPDMSPFLFANAILNDKPIKVFNNGNLRRDFTYIDDIVHGINGLVEASVPQKKLDQTGKIQAPSRIFNIGNNSSIQLLDFIEIMENALGKKAILEMYPMQQGDVYETCASVEELNKITGYTPSISIGQGLPLFVKWFRSYYKL
jgi:UDP-glucuronate 4-epimerase